MPVVELPDGRVVDVADEDMAAFEQALVAEYSENTQEPPAQANVQEAAEAAQSKVAEDLSGGQRFLVGVGKVVNDVIAGVAQLTGDEEQAAAIGDEIKRQRETYKILDDKQVGLEDLGEIVGDASLLAVGGTAGATVKGGILLGGIIEGIKATEEGDLASRAEGAAAGAAGGAIGGAAAKAFMPNPAADALADGAMKGNALVDFIVGGIGKAFGMSRSDADRLVMRGASNLLHKGKQAAQVVATPKVPSGAVYKTAVDAKRTALQSARQKELNQLGVDMLERAGSLINSMSSRGRAGVLVQETGQTLQDVVASSTRTLSDGRVGISYGEFIKSMAQFSNKQLKGKLGDTYEKQLRVLIADIKKRADEVVSPDQIAAEVAEYADLILKGDVKIDQLGPKAVEVILTRVRQAGQAAVQQAARAPALGVAAGTSDLTGDQVGPYLLQAAQSLAQ